MQTHSPEQIETLLRHLPTLVTEMQTNGGTPDQIRQLMSYRCQSAADLISQFCHFQIQPGYQPKKRIIPGGGSSE